VAVAGGCGSLKMASAPRRDCAKVLAGAISSQKGILIGKAGRCSRRSDTGAPIEMGEVFDGPRYLECFVNVVPNWRRKCSRGWPSFGYSGDEAWLLQDGVLKPGCCVTGSSPSFPPTTFAGPSWNSVRGRRWKCLVLGAVKIYCRTTVAPTPDETAPLTPANVWPWRR